MPIQAPMTLAKVDPLIREKLELAMANREREVIVAQELTKWKADNLLIKLRAMRAGLKRFQPPGSELQLLAANGCIHFQKEYTPSLPAEKRHLVFMTVSATSHRRPSDIAREAMADFVAGRRSSPF